MPNSQLIDSLVDDATFVQLDKLEKALAENVKSFVSAAAAVKLYSDEIAGVQSLQELTVKTQAAKKSTDQLAASQDKLAAIEIQLRTARRKAFDDFENNLAKEAKDKAKAAAADQNYANRKSAADQKELQRQVTQRNARIKNIDDYNKKLAQQAAAEKKAADAAEEANRPYNKLNTELGVLRQRAKDIGVEFGINSVQFRDAAVAVNELDKQLKDIDAKLGQKQRNVGNYPQQKIDEVGNSIVAAGAGLLSVDTVVKIIQENAKIADSYSDVQRTANLTDKQVDALDKTLRKIDSRTNLNDLIGIATIGGQLGVATEDLGGFTKAIDQLAVTLSGEIPGGAEAVATALGKINGVFKIQEKEGLNTEQALNKTGSAILKLGQVGLATGDFLQDFALRTAGVAQSARISLPTILAYSAVLEETGNSAEVSGTAFNKLVGALSSKRNNFFAIAKLADSNLTLKDFTNTINTDANKALQQFFAGLNRGGTNLTSFTDLLDSLNLKGAASKNAIVALAQNQDLLNQRIGESVEAYNEGSLSAEQFKIKNDNLAGSLDKINNEITKISTGRGFSKIIKEGADAVVVLLKETDRLIASRSWREFAARVFDPSGLLGGFSPSDRFDKVNSLKDSFSKNSELIPKQKIGSAIPGVSDVDFDFLTGTVRTKSDIKKSKTEALKDFRETRQAALSALTDYNTFKNAVQRGELKDTGGELAKYKQLADYFAARAVVLKDVYKNAKDVIKVPKGDVDISGALDPDGKKASAAQRKADAAAKRADSAEKKRILLLSENYKAEQDLAIKDLDSEYRAGGSKVDQTAAYEKQKLDIIDTGVSKRQALYAKDSTEYKKLEAEKIGASTEAQRNIATALQKSIDEGLAFANKAQAEEIQSLRDANSGKLEEIENQRAKEVDAVNNKYADGLIGEKQYAQKIYDIEAKAVKDRLQLQIDGLQGIIDNEKRNLVVGLGTSKQIGEDEKTLAALKIRLSEATTKKKIDDLAKQKEAAKQLQDAEIQIGMELLSFATQIGKQGFDQRLSQLQDEQDANEKKQSDDIDAVNNSALTEQQKADKIAIINAKAAAQKSLLDQKTRQEKERQARFDKAASIAQIIANTAVAVMKTYAEFGFPIGVPLAIAQAAIGAIQVATVLATPIPKFKDGGEMKHDGIAQFGEQGHELRINPNGDASLTPATTTHGFVEKGTRFFSTPETKRMMAEGLFNANRFSGGSSVNLDPLLKSNTENSKRLEKAIIKSSGSGQTVITKHGWYATQQRMEKVNSFIKRNS